jgi:hypothetical protein
MVLLVAATGCDRGDQAAPRVSAGDDGAEPSGPSLPIRFDGREVARVRAADLSGRTRLEALLPAAYRDTNAWLAVEARAGDGRRMTIPEPARRYADHTPCVYVVDDDEFALGWVMRGRDAPRGCDGRDPRLSLVRIDAIDVATELPERPRYPDIEISVDGAEPIAISDAELRRLPRQEPAIEGSRRESRRELRRETGWRLRDVVALAAAHERVARLTLHAADAREASFDAGKMNAGVVLKRNRHGHLIARWRDAQTGERRQLRDVRRIDMTSADHPDRIAR